MTSPWARNLTEEVLGGPPFVIGDVVKHPNGRMVKITGGSYWGHRGLSNYWYWREVLENGELGPTISGYGWRSGS